MDYVDLAGICLEDILMSVQRMYRQKIIRSFHSKKASVFSSQCLINIFSCFISFQQRFS